MQCKNNTTEQFEQNNETELYVSIRQRHSRYKVHTYYIILIILLIKMSKLTIKSEIIKIIRFIDSNNHFHKNDKILIYLYRNSRTDGNTGFL